MQFNQTQSVKYPLLLGVPSMPIAWMGTIFDCKLDKVGPGGEMTIQVHGSVSDDGEWIENMSFSERIDSKGAGNVVLYQVELLYVPITLAIGQDTLVAGTFERVGADVQKHVESLQYFQTGGPTPVSYTSTDWNAMGNQRPWPRLTFEIVPSEDVRRVPLPGGM